MTGLSNREYGRDGPLEIKVIDRVIVTDRVIGGIAL